MMKSPRSRLAILILAAAVIFSSGISALAEEKPMKEGSGFLPNLFVR